VTLRSTPTLGRTRLIALAAICLLIIGGTLTYLLRAHSDRQRAARDVPKVAQTDIASVQSQPHIVFRSTAIGSDYGKVAMVPIANPVGPRAITSASCDRVYATRQRVLCLSSDRGIVTTYKAQILDSDLHPQRDLPLAGIPSRARLSSDGRLAASTSFTAGDSYAGTSFSTRTVIISLDGSATETNLENYRLIDNGTEIRPVDRNFWGVTFASDDDTFFATAAWGGHTSLVKGSISRSEMVTLRSDAECPSLSPDGRTVVYKKRNGQPAGHWRLASLDLASNTETLLAETRTVDDQVDWLDTTHVIYGLARSGSQAAVDDVWSVASDGRGAPSLLIPQAWSPAVVR
jgi:hypothetical protein